jgi:hypothetical protein
MKFTATVAAAFFAAFVTLAQDTNGVVGDPAYVAPPVVVTPAITNDVVVVENVVTTNTVTMLTTNRVARREQIVTTNATLLRFVVDIDTNQVPTRFTSYMSDGSVVVTAAGTVGSLTNRAALSTFNVLLRDVVSNGRRSVNTNVAWRARGTNGVGRLQRVWSAASARP